VRDLLELTPRKSGAVRHGTEGSASDDAIPPPLVGIALVKPAAHANRISAENRASATNS